MEPRRLWNLLIESGIALCDRDQHVRIRRSNVVSVFLVIVGLLHSLIYLYLGLLPIAISLALFAVAMSGIIFLNRIGWRLAARYYLPFIFTSAVATEIYMVGPLAGLTHLLLPGILSSFISFDSSEKKHLVISLTVTSLLAFSAVVVGQMYTGDTYLVNPKAYPYLRVISWAITTGLLIFLLFLFYRLLEESHAELKSSHRLTTEMLDSFDDPYLFLDNDGRVKYMNAKTRKGFENLGLEAQIGFDFFGLHTSLGQQPRKDDLVRMSFERSQPFRGEYFEKYLNEWLEVTTVPSVSGMSVNYRNIDERVQKEQALRESEMMQRAILEKVATGICILSAEGICLRVNPYACRLLGYSEQEILGTDYLLATLPEEYELDTKNFRNLQQGAVDVTSRAKRCLRKNGEVVTCHVQKSAVRNDKGELEFLIVSIQDLTEQKAAEQRLLQAAKMSSLGEMAGSIAHEINNPMTIIALSAEQLEMAALDKIVAPEIVSKAATRISETVARVTKIIRGLKTFSRNAESDPMTVASLSAIVEDSLELCREKFKNKGIELRTDQIPGYQLLCRPTELSQVLLNLLGNAFDAIEQKDGDRWVTITAVEKAGWVRLSVTDSGSGIPEDVARRILEPFFTTKELGKGTGLGLSISKGIVEAHGGRLYLDRSNPRTSFVIELKLSAES